MHVFKGPGTGPGIQVSQVKGMGFGPKNCPSEAAVRLRVLPRRPSKGTHFLGEYPTGLLAS